MQKNLTSLL